MKKLLPVFIIILIVGVTMFAPHRCVADDQKIALDTFSSILESGDSFYYVLDNNKDTVDWWYDNNGIKDSIIIEDVIKSYAADILTPEEAAHWDSMNAEGGYMLVRGAERYLDTVVNHLHFIFITER